MSKGPRRLRNYALVQGRTHANTDLPLDTLLSGENSNTSVNLTPEQTQIVEWCTSAPQSLVDLSAALQIPVGVVRVLLADLLTNGVLEVHTDDGRTVPVTHDLALLEEVLDAIEAL